METEECAHRQTADEHPLAAPSQLAIGRFIHVVRGRTRGLLEGLAQLTNLSMRVREQARDLGFQGARIYDLAE